MPLNYYVGVGFLALYGGLITGTLSAQVEKPEMVNQTTGQAPWTSAIALGASGTWAAVMDGQGQVRIFDFSGGRIARTIKIGSADGAFVSGAMSSHSQKEVLAVTAGGKLGLFHVMTGEAIWVKDIGVNCGSSLAFGPSGIALICTERLSAKPFVKTLLRTFDLETGRELNSRGLPDGTISTVLSPDAKWAAGSRMPMGAKQIFANMGKGGVYTTTLIVETDTGKTVGEVEGTVLALSAISGQALVSSGRQIQLLDVRSGTSAKILEANRDIPVLAVCSPDASKCLLSGPSGRRVLDTATGKLSSVGDAALLFTNKAAIGSDNDQVAIEQGESILLLKISDPSYRRTVGNPAAVPFTTEAMKNTLAGAQPPIHNMSKKEQRRLTEEYFKRFRKAKTQGERERLERELNLSLSGDPEEQGRAEAREMVQHVSKFGAGVMMPPSATLIQSGRLLVVRAADLWLDLWDVGTGNRLPFRKKPTTFTTSLGTSSSLLLQRSELEELETALTGDQPKADKGLAAAEVGCRSASGKHMVAISRIGTQVTSVILHSVGSDKQTDLLALGIKVSPSNRESNVPGPSIASAWCTLSSDGTRMIVGRTSDGFVKGDGRFVAPSLERGPVPRTASGFVVYDLKSGREISKLTSSTGSVQLNLAPSELQFTSDGSLILGSPVKLDPRENVYPRFGVRLWDVWTGRQIPTPVVERSETFIGFGPDGRTFITSLASPGWSVAAFGLRVRDLASTKLLFEIPDVLSEADRLFTSNPGNVLIGPDRDNALGFWDLRTGDRLGSLYAYQEGEWLVTTPSGLFDGSPRGWTQVAWRGSTKELTTSPGELFFNEFYRPGLLAELIEGRRPASSRSISQVDRRQPLIRITTDQSGANARTVNVHLSVQEVSPGDRYENGSGVRDLRLFRNGTLVKAWRGDMALVNGQASVSATIAITAGENRIVAYAFNRDNVKGTDATVTVKSGAESRPGTLYLLSIGINQYANPEFDLKFAAPDAERLAEQLAASQRRVGRLTNIVSVKLFDRDATRANIALALSILGGQHQSPLQASTPSEISKLRLVEPEDTVIMFFAGHGVATGDRFYLVPHDLGYSGARQALQGSLSNVLRAGISDLDLEKAFETIDASNLMLIIDACSAGKALDSDEERRGPMNSKGLAQLAYEKGMYILTAAQAYQAALESSKLGHGYLTYALVAEGLVTPDADSSPKDGEVTAVEWFEHAARRVPQMQMRAIREAGSQGRLLTFESTGENLAGGRLQMPRSFYRRDNAGVSFVIAKP